MQYEIFNGIKVLYEPDYDDSSATKKILGIYHPLNSEIYVFDEDEWAVFNKISSDRDLDLEDTEILATFKKYKIVNDKNSKIKVSLKYTPNDAQLYVKLTEACNFSCPGCTTSIDRIPLSKAKILDIETLNLYLESFIRSASEKKMDKVKIKWAGGEPLLNNSYQLIENAQSQIQVLQKKYPNIFIHQIILTNGVFISEEKVKFFKANNITLSVSLWGTGKVQDDARKPRNNMETYDVIVKNISLLETASIDYSINYVLTPTNANNFREFIDSVWNINSSKFIGSNWKNKHPITIFIAFYRPQTNISLYTSELMYKKMLKGSRNGFGLIKELINQGIPIQTLNIIDYLNFTGIAPYTCGSGINYVAVGPEGAAACHEDLFEMKSNLDDIKSNKNIIDIVNKKHKKYLKYYSGLTYQENEKFSYLLLHGGLGCPRLRNAEDSAWKESLGTTFRFYDGFIDELLSLECMRLTMVS